MQHLQSIRDSPDGRYRDQEEQHGNYPVIVAPISRTDIAPYCVDIQSQDYVHEHQETNLRHRLGHYDQSPNQLGPED